MAKDYAKYTYKTKRPLLKKGWRQRMLGIIIVLFLSASLIYGFYLYKKEPADYSRQSIAMRIERIKSLFSHKHSPPEGLASQASHTVPHPRQEPEIQFNFYNELPNMQSMIGEKLETSKKEITPIPTIAVRKESVNEKKSYILEMEEFQSQAAAGEMRITLLLSGFEVDVVQSLKDNKKVYRLQQGPFESMAQAKAIQQKLKKKGIESTVRKMG